MIRDEEGMGMLKVRASTRAVAAIACGMVVCASVWPQDDSVVAAVVTSVIDGDTIKVQLSAGPVLVRLAKIDAPEPIQSGGGAATRALHNRILGQPVSLWVVKRDRDLLLVAVVFLGDENINAWMVKQGHAWADRGQTPEPDYCIWENAARSLRRGLWADKHWISPWDWRITQRDSLFFVSDYSNASTAGCMKGITETVAFDE